MRLGMKGGKQLERAGFRDDGIFDPVMDATARSKECLKVERCQVSIRNDVDRRALRDIFLRGRYEDVVEGHSVGVGSGECVAGVEDGLLVFPEVCIDFVLRRQLEEMRTLGVD